MRWPPVPGLVRAGRHPHATYTALQSVRYSSSSSSGAAAAAAGAAAAAAATAVEAGAAARAEVKLSVTGTGGDDTATTRVLGFPRLAAVYDAGKPASPPHRLI